ncbi:hypothetical protein ABH932_005318 [Streptacidiphilus sp. MAP5-52]
MKQAAAAPSALSLLHPSEGITGYSPEQFLVDPANEAETDIPGGLDADAHVVQLDFEEARPSLKLDPSAGPLDDFIALNNRVLSRFTGDERARIGVYTGTGAARWAGGLIRVSSPIQLSSVRRGVQPDGDRR